MGAARFDRGLFVPRLLALSLTGACAVFGVGCSESDPAGPAYQTSTTGNGSTGAVNTTGAGSTASTQNTSAASTGGSTLTSGAASTTTQGTTTSGVATTTGTVGAVTSVGVTTTGATTAVATTTGATGAGGSTSTGVTTGGGTCTLEEERFSFFMTSQAALVRESGNADGFGGNLGGISGADQICQNIAVFSTPCAGSKVWRAFLSTTSEDAIDRIGQGPWYDRVGRLLANDTSELVVTSGNDERALVNADSAIRDDLPNEDGVPNHRPEGSEVDNHQTLTGSGLDGRLYTQGASGGGFGSTACNDGEWTSEKATCWNWTVSDPVGCPRVGHSWPRDISGINWISVWNEGGCAPGGVLDESVSAGPDGTARVGSAGGYGGFYCFAVTGQ